MTAFYDTVHGNSDLTKVAGSNNAPSYIRAQFQSLKVIRKLYLTV